MHGCLCMYILSSGTYDVQSVSASAIAGGLELSCTFATGSQARSCVLTVCRVEDNSILKESCTYSTISRNNNSLTSIKQEPISTSGMYSIVQVGEVESSGRVTVVELMGEISILYLPPVSTTSTPG